MLNNGHMPIAEDDAVSLTDIVVRTIAAITDRSDDAVSALRSLPDAEAAVRAVEAARREVEGLRRREQELSALFSSARELAAVRDTDAVLTRLVERAHEMLGSDVTYLSEYDPDTGRLHVRATYGAVTTALRELVVPPGRGLVSVVVETGAPQAVSRYSDYAAERHEPVVDDAVAEEGIVSMLGVPLRTETAVLGVLFVSMRQERTFGPEQIALLSALADHASIVLQTADRMRSLRRSEEEARATLERLSEHLAERDRSNTVHQQLVSAVLTGGGFSRIAETLADTLDRAVRIVDERGDERAASGDAAALRAADAAELDAAVDASRSSGHAAVVPGPAGTRVVAALAAGTRSFGAVHIDAGSFDLGAVDLRTVERAAQVGALLALAEEAVVEAQQRQQVDLLADIVASSPDRRVDVTARLRRLGLDLEALSRLVLVAVAGEHRPEALRVLTRRVGAAGLVGELDGVLVVLADPSRIDLDAAASLTAVAAALPGSPVLAVDAPSSTAGPGERYELARRALRILRALGIEEGSVKADALLPYAAVLDADQRTLTSFFETAIGPVRRYDAERGTELLSTLRAFVRSGASPTRTARALTFHPNTILQRLDRLDAVLGAGWREDERFFRISMAVRLDELREQLAAR
jgi:GAF domain-containing protein